MVGVEPVVVGVAAGVPGAFCDFEGLGGRGGGHGSEGGLGYS